MAISGWERSWSKDMLLITACACASRACISAGSMFCTCDAAWERVSALVRAAHAPCV